MVERGLYPELDGHAVLSGLGGGYSTWFCVLFSCSEVSNGGTDDAAISSDRYRRCVVLLITVVYCTYLLQHRGIASLWGFKASNWEV